MTDIDINKVIYDHAGNKTDDELTIFINLITGKNYKKSAIKKRRQRLGIKKANGRGVCLVTNIKEASHDKYSKSVL